MLLKPASCDELVLKSYCHEPGSYENSFPSTRLPRSNHIQFFIQINILLGTEVSSEGNAVEVLTDLALIDGCHVKQNYECCEHNEHSHQADPNQKYLPPSVVRAERNIGQEGIRQEEPEDKTEDVGVVVHPGQKANEEQHEGDGNEAEQGSPRIANERPAVDHLDKEASEEAELGARRPHLCAVRHKNRGREITCDSRHYVNNPDTNGTRKLLEITHQVILEEDCD